MRRAQRLTTEMQIRAESVESELRKANQLRSQELNRRLAALEIELAEEKNTKKIVEYQAKQAMTELTAEFEVQRSELTRISREKDVLHEKVRDIEGKYEMDKKQFAIFKKESTATISSLEKVAKDFRLKITESEAKILDAKSTELDNIFASQMQKAANESLRNEQSATIESLKRESHQRAADLEKVYVEKLGRIKENTREALEKVCHKLQVFMTLNSQLPADMTLLQRIIRRENELMHIKAKRMMLRKEERH